MSKVKIKFPVEVEDCEIKGGYGVSTVELKRAYSISYVSASSSWCFTSEECEVASSVERKPSMSIKMYKMLESVANELYMLIDEVNDQRASRITPQTECEPDYHDMQTIHEIQRLLAEARGVDIESS